MSERARVVVGYLAFVTVVLVTYLIHETSKINAATYQACPAPVPTEAMCWCVSAKGNQVYVQEIARPQMASSAAPQVKAP